MDEDFLKRNTDCVYFLASPLTCKKGAECEYRHHEIARLNPRDCWFWLSGNCFNPTCAFRHPPLDGHTGVPSKPSQSSVPPNKTLVPCYFFFNGFCNKGDRCSFLHGPEDSYLTAKPVKNDKGATDALNSENKVSSGNKTVVASTPAETHVDPSLTAPKALSDLKPMPMPKPKEDLQLPLPKNVKQQNDCLELPAFEYEEAEATQSESPYPDEGFVHNMSHLSTEQNSEELVNGHIEPEERWESSPGFDVIVHDESENMGYEDDSEYLPVLDGEHQELNEQYLRYEFKDPDEYDTMCLEADVLYEQEMYDGYRCLDRDLTHGNGRRVPACSREIMFDSILTRKRIRMADMAACDRNLDLRDHLRRRRETSDPPDTGYLRRHESSSLMVREPERHHRHCSEQHHRHCSEQHHRHCSEQRLSRRMTSQVGFSTIDSMGKVETLSTANRQRFYRNSQHHRPRMHYREKTAKRHFVSSNNVSRKPVLKQRRFIHESSTFTGPKSLAEIRQEKMVAGESWHCKTTSSDFQDPKPLSEILKIKRSVD